MYSQKPTKFDNLFDSASKYEHVDWNLSYSYAKMALQNRDADFSYEDIISLNTIFDTYYQKRNMLDSAFNINKQSLRLATQHNNKILIAYSLNNMAGIYDLAGNYWASIEMYRQSLKMLEELGEIKQMANTSYNMHIPFTSLKLLDSARYYTDKAFANYKKINDYSGIASCYDSYGSDEDRVGNYAEAVKFYNLEIENFRLANEPASLIIPYQNMADTYLKYKKYKECRFYLDSAMELSIAMGSRTDVYDVSNTFAKYYEAIGDYKNANFHMRKYYEGKDTMLSTELKTEMSDQKSQFDRENSENMLTIQKLEAEQNFKSRETIKWVLIISSLFFVIVIALSVNRYRIKQKSFIKLNEYKNQLILQKEKIEENQKEIIDSINYAQRIQSAILAMEEDILNYFPESFLIYKPKNIVAGDFYFFETTATHVFYAAADCTGHGVPGALVSVVCANALTRCVKEFGLTDPGQVLDKTRDLVLETFNRSGKEVKDGMDISLCSFEINNLKANASHVNIKWAGANNSLWYILNGQLLEIKANKQAIGYIEHPLPYTTHSLSLERNTVVYLFTDGYVDQFGGEKGKKLKFRQLEQRVLSIYTYKMAEQKDNLENYFSDWKGDLEQVDDVLVLGIKL
ncbi:MAG: SpoIIE family protein phosphatase [Bacteroidota bacterium]